jgi:fructuronate reductase
VSRLCEATLENLPSHVERPAYDRAAAQVGVVHFGPGAFHRAHQAHYLDRLLASGRSDWAVCAVSLRSPDVAEALGPQDGLYTLMERGAARRHRVIGALKEVLVGPRHRAQVIGRLADPATRLVTSTVTEKGYCLTQAGDLDLQRDDIRHDLANLEAPETFIGWLVQGLRARQAARAGGLVVAACDNLSGNGRKLRAAALAFARESRQADLAMWIEDAVAFPCSMVDSITPATTDETRAEVATALGVDDAWPIQREPFVQWVIEPFGADAEVLAEVGVTLSSDVAAWERAKLRLLNGAHSALAYLGLLRGHATVSEAMDDADLGRFVEEMMLEEIAPTVRASGVDVTAYVGDVLARFRNPGIAHQLSQIAWDGSQKLPFRLLETMADRLADNAPIDRLAIAIAGWMRFVEGRAAQGEQIVDPLAGRLAGTRGVENFLTLSQIFPARLAVDTRFRDAISAAYRRPEALGSH